MAVMIYGASGRTGHSIARELARAGQSLVLGGRNEDRLRLVAKDVPGDIRVAAPDRVGAVLTPEVEVIVNVAGPFEHTVAPVARAAARAGVHYVDLANELAAAQTLVSLAPQFASAGRTAVPAAGFGTVATDTLARHLVDAFPDTVRLELGMHVSGDGRSPGAALSSSAIMRDGGVELVDGVLRRSRIGARSFDLPGPGRMGAVPVGLADLVVTPLTTGVRNVSAGFAVSMPPRLARLAMPLVATLLEIRPPAPRRPRGGGEYGSRAWAAAWLPDGTSASATLEAGEGYDFSARAAAATVLGLLRTPARPGVASAVGLFGSTLAVDAGGVISSVSEVVDAPAQ